MRTVLRQAGCGGLALWLAAGCGADDASEATSASGDFGGGGGGSGGLSGGDYDATTPDAGGGWGGPDADSADPATGGNTNVSFGGEQDFGYFRRVLAEGQVPRPGEFSASGFFAEHFLPLPDPECGERVCLQVMSAVLGNLMDGANCTMLRLGLNSPIVVNPDERPPLSLAVVVDVSGSMDTGGKMDFVREGLEYLIDEMRDGDEIALITYQTDVAVPFELGPVATSRSELRDLVRGLVANGGTNLHGGLEAGYQALLSNFDSGRQQRVLLLSDGEPTVGQTDAPTILDMSRSFNSEGIGLTTIGLGTDFNYALMRDLALRGDGNFYFLENSGAVSEVFTEELAYFTVPVAYDVTLELTAGSLYQFGMARGTPLWENTANGGRLELPSVFLAHRESDDDVTEEGGRRGGGSALLVELMPRMDELDAGVTEAEIAEVTMTYREPGTDRIVSQERTMIYPFNPATIVARGFFESPVLSMIQKSFVMLNAYVAVEMACTMFHANEGAAAVPMLRRVIAAIEDYNEEEQDTDMDYNLELLRDLLALIERLTTEPIPETEIPANPWPAD